MNLAEIIAAPVNGMGDYARLQEALLADLEAQLAARGLRLVKALPSVYCFGAVVATQEELPRFVHVTIDDVRANPGWASNVRLRRMSSERDWKGDVFHYCTWEGVGEAAATYLTAEYDCEIYEL